MKRAAAIVIALSVAALSSANYMTAPAFSLYNGWSALAYVAAYLLLEAWWIGMRGGLDWKESLARSFIANFVTAALSFMCAGFLGFPDLSTVWVGSRWNPDPLQTTLRFLCIFAALSAITEFLFWIKDLGWRKALGRTLVAHLIGIPMGLVILLTPSRPYTGLESVVGRLRSIGRHRLIGAMAHGRLQVARSQTAEALLSELAREDGMPPSADAWALAYRAAYERFDRAEQRRYTYELNVEGLESLGPGSKTSAPGKLWILRYREGPQSGWGTVIDLPSDNVRDTDNPKQLGF